MLPGIVMLVNEEQYSKAYAPIDVTLFGISISVKFSQCEKALFSIVVTLSGIVTFTILSQLANA